MKAAGILVIFFVIFNLNSQFGITLRLANTSAKQDSTQIQNSNQPVQEIDTVFTEANDINPSIFTVKVGQPVKFVVDAKDDGSGCMSTIMIPGLWNKAILLRKGQQIVMQFTPQTTGTYQITCAMGVPRGKIIVE
jgi:plastocyanin domain-containing protein